MRLPAVLFASLAVAAGQAVPPVPSTSKPTLEYSGKPLALPFQCTDDDIHWAGMSCSDEEPCPLYLELTAAESVGNKIFVAGNLHSSNITLYSILLASEDSGRTWREAHERIRGAGLDHIQFIDFETGWVSGQALSPLPQDPFLLITSDGGKTWRKKDLFSEGRVGSIQQFWFSAKNSGSMIIDRGAGGEGSRYELYESPNAGETWMVRETSDRPIKLKRGPSGVSPWRIRTDAASKSFRIDRQGQGDRWTAVAAFLVAAGGCKPTPPKEVAEPPTAEPSDAPPAPPAPAPIRRQPPSLKRVPK